MPDDRSATCEQDDLLRDELITDTVAKATRHSPYYHELYERHGVASLCVRSVDDLPCLPIVDKDSLRRAGRDALCNHEGLIISHVQNTSGSTGEPFFIYRSSEEVDFIQRFFSELAASDDSPAREMPIMLQLPIPQHGVPTPIPGRVFVLQASVTDDSLIDHALLLLSKEFNLCGVENRVSILAGSHLGVLLMTNFVLESGIDASQEFAVRSIHLTGRYLTSRWRTVLSHTWGGNVRNKYSLSEVFGGASSCPHCTGFHFDPYVVPELVHPVKKNRVENGTGVLVLTTLHPFVQLQPFIRYWTGDLFRIARDVCIRPSFFYQGRLRHALFDPDDSDVLLLTGVDILDTFDAIPQVNRSTHYRDVTRLQYQQSVGSPRVRGLIEKREDAWVLRIQAELMITPGLFPFAIRELAERVRMDLLNRSAPLAFAVSSKRIALEIEFTAPRSIPSVEKNTILWGKV